MEKERYPVLRMLYIPYEVEQILKIEYMDNNLSFNDVLVRYIILGLSTQENLSFIRNFPQKNSKSIAIPARLDRFISDKTKVNNAQYNNICIEYLIIGIKSEEKIINDRLQSNWIKELNKFCSTLKKI